MFISLFVMKNDPSNNFSSSCYDRSFDTWCWWGLLLRTIQLPKNSWKLIKIGSNDPAADLYMVFPSKFIVLWYIRHMDTLYLCTSVVTTIRADFPHHLRIAKVDLQSFDKNRYLFGSRKLTSYSSPLKGFFWHFTE